MKYFLILLISFISLSCSNQRKDKIKEMEVKLNEVKETSISSSITYFDNDSIYNNHFNSVSRYDGDELKWEISIYEDGILQQVIKDSINSMSYLIKAIDSNNDNNGELVFVTGKFHPAFDKTETIRCNIFIYAKKEGVWTRFETPKLTDKQLTGYFGNEVVSIENNKIKRKFTIYDGNKIESGKERVLIYGMDKENQLILIEEKIKDANKT